MAGVIAEMIFTAPIPSNNNAGKIRINNLFILMRNEHAPNINGSQNSKKRYSNVVDTASTFDSPK